MTTGQSNSQTNVSSEDLPAAAAELLRVLVPALDRVEQPREQEVEVEAGAEEAEEARLRLERQQSARDGSHLVLLVVRVAVEATGVI